MSVNKKIKAAEEAIKYIENNMKIGLGTGSTADEFTKLLSIRVKEGLDVVCVPTSESTKKLANELGIILGSLNEIKNLDLTVDGADEIDDDLSLIKGGGGALLREKIIAYNSNKMIVIADDSKKVKKLGSFKLPVEVVCFEHETTNYQILKKLEDIGYYGQSEIRLIDGSHFKTDSGNFIYDLSIGLIEEPYMVNDIINSIPGVVENGLFVEMADLVILGGENKAEVIEK